MHNEEIKLPGDTGIFMREDAWERAGGAWTCRGAFFPAEGGDAPEETPRGDYPTLKRDEQGRLTAKGILLRVTPGEDESVDDPDFDPGAAKWLEWELIDRVREIDRIMAATEQEIERLRGRLEELSMERAERLCPFDVNDVVEDKTLGTRLLVQKIVSHGENSWKLYGKRVYKTGFLSDSDHEMAPERHELVKVGQIDSK